MSRPDRPQRNNRTGTVTAMVRVRIDNLIDEEGARLHGNDARRILEATFEDMNALVQAAASLELVSADLCFDR